MLTPKFISTKYLLTPKFWQIIKLAFSKKQGRTHRPAPYDVHFVTNHFTMHPRAGML